MHYPKTESARFDEIPLSWLRAKPGVKWSTTEPGVLPAWIADMDFPPPEPVLEAIHRSISTGDLGYPGWLTSANPVAEAFVRRMDDCFGWMPDPSRAHVFTDVLNGLAAVLGTVTSPGDIVAVHGPTYPPFLSAFSRLSLEVREIPFHNRGIGWEFDPEIALRQIAKASVLLIVNPHNPTGRSLTREELEVLTNAALQSDTLIISDEVHAELLYPGNTHIPTAALNGASERTVTFQSASKTFNLAGMCCAVGWIGPDEIHETLTALPERYFGAVSNLGVEATLAAWEHGSDWLATVLTRLEANRDLIGRFLAERLPAIGYAPPEATYLAWLDFGDVWDDPAGELERRAGVRLSPGSDFGRPSFARLNFATGENVLMDILERISSTFGSIV